MAKAAKKAIRKARKPIARKPRTVRRAKLATGVHRIIAREVDSLVAEKAALESRLDEISNRLAGLQVARDVFEGKPYSPPVGPAPKLKGISRTGRAAKGTKSTGRRGGISQQVLQAISSGKATSRSALVELFGHTDNKLGQMSISNALSQLNRKKLIKAGKARGEWVAS